MIPATCPLLVQGALSDQSGTRLEVVNPTGRTYTIVEIDVGVVDAAAGDDLEQYAKQQTSRLPTVVRVFKTDFPVAPSRDAASMVPFPLADDPNLLAGSFDVRCE